MSFSYYILTGVILMYRHTCYNTVYCQDVSMILPRTVLFQQEKLKFGCSPSNVARWNFVALIILSKNISTVFQDIVSVGLSFEGPIRNETVWKQSSWQKRATVIKEYVNPVTTSTGLEFDIQPINLLCLDEGTYRCTIIGSSANHAPIERESMGTMEFSVKPTTINQIEVSPKPEIDELHIPNTQIELSCTGTVGRNPAGEIRWCYRRDDMLNFIGWPNPDDYDQGMLVQLDCQNSRTSTLRYNVSADYKYTEFRCETGGTTMVCGHPSAIASNITIYRYSEPIQPTTTTSDSEPKQSTTLTYDETTDSGSVQSTPLMYTETKDSGSLQSTSVINTETKESASGDNTSSGSTLKTTESASGDSTSKGSTLKTTVSAAGDSTSKGSTLKTTESASGDSTSKGSTLKTTDSESPQSTSVMNTETKESAPGESTSKGSTSKTTDSESLQSTPVMNAETEESASGDSTSRGAILKTTERTMLIVCAVVPYLLVNGWISEKN